MATKMSGMRARAMEKADLELARRVVEQVHAGDPVYAARARNLESKLGMAWVVEDRKGSLLAVATLSESRLHPHDFLAVDGPDSQQAEVISCVLPAVRTLSKRPLFSRLRPHRFGWLEAYAQFGFSVVERASQCIADPVLPIATEWVEDVLAERHDDLRLVRLDDDNIIDAARLLADWYRRVHIWSPPRFIDPQEALSLFLDPMLSPSVGVADAGGTLLAVGVVSPDPFSADNRLGHVEFVVCGEGLKSEEAIIEWIYASVCARSAGVLSTLRLTASDIYPPAVRAAERTPFHFEPELVIVAESHDPR